MRMRDSPGDGFIRNILIILHLSFVSVWSYNFTTIRSEARQSHLRKTINPPIAQIDADFKLARQVWFNREIWAICGLDFDWNHYEECEEDMVK